jgi:triosephosphate isomerase (TIM)
MKKLIAGNWKMNGSLSMVCDFSSCMNEAMATTTHDVLICLPYPYINYANKLFASKNILLGAQDCSIFKDTGAYTGEVSAEMLRDLGCSYVIVGHSERRDYFNESNEVVQAKLGRALEASLNVILCVGETLEERNKGTHFDKIKNQILSAMSSSSDDNLTRITIAYEPIWAIGTGLSATSVQANEMHEYIHDIISKHFGTDNAKNVAILYGGSMNEKNAKDLLSQSYIGGGLIGGASLKSEILSQIVTTKI